MGDRIELKAFCSDPEATAEAVKDLGAKESGALEERDTYFQVHRMPRGRLLLRRTEYQPARLIAYALANQPGIHRTAAVVAEVPATGADALAGVLAAANGVRAEVVKRRRTFLHKQTLTLFRGRTRTSRPSRQGGSAGGSDSTGRLVQA